MKIYIRTELIQSRGIGHWMRMWALSEWLQKYQLSVYFYIECSKFEIDFVLEKLAETDLVKEKHYSLIIASSCNDQEPWFGDLEPNDVVVVDSYMLGQSWLDTLAGYTEHTLLVDDDPNSIRKAPIVVDPTAKPIYGGTINNMLGAEYFIANKILTEINFRKRHEATVSNKGGLDRGVNRIFLSFGGTDVAKLIPYVIDVLIGVGMGAKELFIAVSEGVSHEEEIISAIKLWSGEVSKNSDMATIVENLNSCDLAIGAAGGMVFERALLGVPAIVVKVAENQSHIFKKLVENNLALAMKFEEFTDYENLSAEISRYINDPDLRNEHGVKGLLFSKSLGGSWLSQWLSRSLWRECYLAPADADFIKTLFDWQKQPSIRRFSRNETCPTWDEHCTWYSNYTNSLKGLMCKIILISDPIGMLRLDLRNTGPFDYEVSILIDPRCQGKGLGKIALKRVRQLVPFLNLYAYIKPDNSPSLRAFKDCGYIPVMENWYLSPRDEVVDHTEVFI